MKRILFFIAITGFLLVTSGCSANRGLLGGGLTSGYSQCGEANGGLFGGGLVRSNLLQDGPVRQWLRGDACDSCNVPAGEITYDSGFDSSCSTCGNVSGPITSAPTTNYYPSHTEPNYGGTSYGGSLPVMPAIGPIDGTSSSISESQFFDGADDNIELPPLSGF